MSKPTDVSRRLQLCIQHLQANDYPGAAVNLFPAIDKTAKKRRPKEGVGGRVKSFLKDEEVLISLLGTGKVVEDRSVDGMSFAEAIYKFGRTPITHEGEIDPRLTFRQEDGLQVDQDHWNLPPSYMAGMALAVVIAPENASERTATALAIGVFGRHFFVNDIWGRREPVETQLRETFSAPDLFNHKPARE